MDDTSAGIVRRGRRRTVYGDSDGRPFAPRVV